MTALLLSLSIALSPMTLPDAVASGCGNASWSHPPDVVRVLRSHKRGSSVPKRVEVWTTDRYVAAVMASGAWPNRVWESAKVGAIAIRQYTVWTVIHTCRSWKGHRYDLDDSEQHLGRGVHPWTHVPARTLRSVRLMAGITLTKHGRHFRTGWSGGRCRDGFHLCEDSIRERAQRGWGWRRIVHWALDPVSIEEGT